MISLRVLALRSFFMVDTHNDSTATDHADCVKVFIVRLESLTKQTIKYIWLCMKWR
jgi:hypothetical protein